MKSIFIGKKFIFIYLFISQLLVISYSFLLREYIYVKYLLLIYLILFLIFRFLNTKKRFEQELIDEENIVPIEPFLGLSLNDLLLNPAEVLSKKDLPPVKIETLLWATYCLQVISKSKDRHYELYVEFIDSINSQDLGFLIPWIDLFHKRLKIKKPDVNLPDDFNVEDFS